MFNVVNNLFPKFNKENVTNSKNTKKAGFSANPIKSIAVSESFKKANPFIKNWDKWLGIATALTSTIGFSVGGAALMSDYLHQLKKGKKATNPENANNTKNVDEKDPFNQFRTIINKNQDIEIEAKFEIDLQRRNGKKAKEPKIEEIMDAFDLQFSPGALWIKDPVNAVATGQNHFYGTEDGEERVVIITKCGGTYLKEKGSVEPYHFGIPAEEFILKRKEVNP